jgi:hypothetical protein
MRSHLQFQALASAYLFRIRTNAHLNCVVALCKCVFQNFYGTRNKSDWKWIAKHEIYDNRWRMRSGCLRANSCRQLLSNVQLSITLSLYYFRCIIGTRSARKEPIFYFSFFFTGILNKTFSGRMSVDKQIYLQKIHT